MDEFDNNDPLTIRDFEHGTTQLEIDAINVLEKRVAISDFDEAYQKKIKDFYKFSPVSVGSANSKSKGGRSFWK